MNLLADSVIKVSLLILATLAATMLTRKASAALRHWVVSAGILCAAAVPLLTLIVPSWQVAITPIVRQSAAAPGPLAGPSLSEPSRTLPPDLNQGSRSGTATASRVAGATWLGGLAITASLLVVAFARLLRLASQAQRLTSGRWFTLAVDISAEYGLSRPVLLLRSPDPTLLVTWGLRQPKILVPAAADTWTPDRIRLVLRHEIAHVCRRDWIVQLAAEAVRCVYWFNPLLWIVCRRLRDESEQACDDVVLARGVDATTYASELLQLARQFAAERRSWSAVPAMARSCSLERRIAAMLTPRINRYPLTRSGRLAIAVAMFGLTAAIAGAAFAQAPTARFSGTVTDPSGAPMPDTTISVTHTQTSAGHAVPTDQAGYFEFAALPVGEYVLEARTPGFASIRESINMEAGASVRRDMRLTIGTVQESITVGAPRSTAVPPRDPSFVKSMVDKFRGKRLQPPLKLTDVRPDYSQALRDAGVEGRVVLEGRIATDGSVTGLKVVEAAHEELVNAARDAASQWRFEPTRLWGTPVETTMTMTFNFGREPR